MTPAEKHVAALEAELARHIAEQNESVSGDAVRVAMDIIRELVCHCDGNPTLRAAGENVVLELLPGTEMVVRADGTCVLNREGREDLEFVGLTEAVHDGGLWQDLREAQKDVSYFEVRPFGRYLEPIDEIVATKARTSIRRIGRGEYLILVNGQGFRMSNALERYAAQPGQGTRTGLGGWERPTINFVLLDPEHSPREGTVEIAFDPGNPGVIDRLKAEDALIHIEQMNPWEYWVGIGAGSYAFHYGHGNEKEESTGPELSLTRIPPWEMEKLQMV